MYRCLLFLILAAQVLSCTKPAAKTYSCEAPAQIQAAITKAGAGGIDALLSQYPGDFWVRRAYIDLKASGIPAVRALMGIPSGPADASLIARFRKDYELRPEDPASAYLYAYSLIHTDTKKSVEILTAVTQKLPSFPTAWLTLAILHSSPPLYDRAKSRQCTEIYLTCCPNTLEPRVASLAMQLDKSETLITYAKMLRKRIEGRAQEEMLPLYPPLWLLETKIAPPAEQDAVRKRIEGDLKFLEGLDKAKFRGVSIVLMQGYQRTGNKEGQDKYKNSTPLTAPAAFLQAQTEWARENPPPAPDASTATRSAYYKKQLQFLDGWRDRVPQFPTLLSARFNALAALPDTSNDMLVREGNQVLAAARNPSTGMLVNPTGYLDVLRAWAQRGLERDRIPGLADEAIAARTLAPAFPMQQSDLYAGSFQSLMTENQRWTTDTGAWSILITAYLKTGRLDKARSIMVEWERALNERRGKAEEINERRTAYSPQSSPISSMEGSIVSGITSDESRYYQARAQLASAEGRTLDALTFYQSFLRLTYGRSAMTGDLKDKEDVQEAERLWKKLGGSQAGWLAWMDSIRTIPMPATPSIPQPRWSAVNRVIPPFLLRDQNGKDWTLARLKGKTTLINVWATWCGPCRSELPLLQKLYEKIKDRRDIQVIALNVDENTNLVVPFLKQNGFAFPSLTSKSFVDGFAGHIGIPTTWISDATGTIRLETRGFSSSSSDWVSQTLKQIESVR